MNEAARFWADPRIVYPLAIAAVALLLATVWLFRRRRRTGRQAALICVSLSLGLHIAMLCLIPMLPSQRGGRAASDKPKDEVGVETITVSSFDPEMKFSDVSGESADSQLAPLPVSELNDLLEEPLAASAEPEFAEREASPPDPPVRSVPEALAVNLPGPETVDESSDYASALSEWLEPTADDDNSPDRELATGSMGQAAPASGNAAANAVSASAAPDADPASNLSGVDAARAAVPGGPEADFANRVGAAKERALLETGGSAQTEAAVQKALQYLVAAQRADGAWDPRASGAGRERSPLGMSRGNAGSRAETAITGLALLSLIGAGHTHQQGEYSQNVFQGLAFLIRSQAPDGSLAGPASVYEATYSHGMAALAMCEAAVMTGDPSAVECARRAVAYTIRIQHPTTGGWRYTTGDPGDLSQLGWQAMVLDGGHRAGIAIDPRSVRGVERFLASVRAGSHGGLATYRAGEAPSRTMTAEALATRLLIGGRISRAEIEEAEQSLLQQPPGTGQDNYYYWYYATLALHQLQDDAWRQWNQALHQRLLSTQRSDGSWPTDSVWGGYGGSVYTTSMGTLCLEAYYRHALRDGARLQGPTRVADRSEARRE